MGVWRWVEVGVFFKLAEEFCCGVVWAGNRKSSQGLERVGDGERYVYIHMFVSFCEVQLWRYVSGGARVIPSTHNVINLIPLKDALNEDAVV